jgi:DNA-binding LacI/PurR family transcriptional regulator
MPDPRSQRATIIDVARRAGVAISSASAALNDRPGVSDQTRERVREAASHLQYVPSLRGRSLSAKRAFSVGFIVERDFSVLEADPFFAAFIGGVEESLAPRDYALSLQVVGDPSTNLARHVDLVDSRRVDGLILSEIRVEDPRIEALRSRRVPVVGINPDPGFPFSSVRQDSDEAIGQLVRRLFEAGHRRLAHVAGPAAYVHSRRRQRAWVAAMTDADLSSDLVVEGDFTHDGGARAADVLLDRSDAPTAVFCANDLMAIGFMNRTNERGLRVPRDVSVAGFDGISLTEYVRPTMTTVLTSPHALGREGARLLLNAIDGDPREELDVGPAVLVVRGSTSRVRRP